MKNIRINKIVTHASKLIRELMKEWIGESEKEDKSHEKKRDPRDD